MVVNTILRGLLEVSETIAVVAYAGLAMSELSKSVPELLQKHQAVPELKTAKIAGTGSEKLQISSSFIPDIATVSNTSNRPHEDIALCRPM